MTVRKYFPQKAGLAGLILVLGAAIPELCHARAGHVLFVVGSATMQRAGVETQLTRGQSVEAADRLLTGPHGFTHIRMDDGAFIALMPSTEFGIEE